MTFPTPTNFNDVCDQVAKTLLWCEEFDAEYSHTAVTEISRICEKFFSDPRTKPALEAANLSWDLVGHDIPLTCNGHGTGFWDRGLGAAGYVLTEVCKDIGQIEVYLGDDGMVYIQN